ncbi:hypothetical protein CPB84DRAFT_1746401 [Gymnopilus junonius]|uniref:Matrin-type domain-containing protein n=1 Tax=Gymnopilus junonius TaxID=109634 RepID=A0A9P5TNJ0_GYMJU|nr:hypothetical protein CPB84DRAFT_1746401 [Gymnopilus junonius]
MSEYWVSKKKYYCKYCDIYIADDAPSRRQHESGLRHKGNLERFIRGIYKAGEKQKKDQEEEKREMKRVEQAAAAAHAQDIAAGLSKSSTPVASTSTAAPKKPAPKPSNPFANYSTSESLGYTDPDAERFAAELERKRSQGVAGEWQIVTSTPPPATSTPEPPEPSASTVNDIAVKREAEAPPDDEDARSFKLRKKTLNMGELYDPDAIPIKIRKKEEPKPEPDLAPTPASSSSQNASSAPLKWKPTQWKRPGEASQPDNEEEKPLDGRSVKAEEEEPLIPSKWSIPQWSQPLPDLKLEDRKSIFGNLEPEEQKLEIKNESDFKTAAPPEDVPPTAGLFKKRKAPAGAGRGRREI